MSDSILDSGPQAGARLGMQKFGRFLSGMVMPNIGAILAWGLITALFIPTGWFPNADLAKLVGPMITFLLPLLIGYTGGKMIYDTRGGVMGALVTCGVVVGASVPMFLGAMIVGPASAWVLKKFDKLLDGKIKPGFEMLINNFSLGIIGGALAIVAFLIIGPAVSALSNILSAGVKAITEWNMLPLANLFIEPGKILFLNNAINHGVLAPIGMAQSAVSGQSIIFMLESNPGPGLGLLLAYWLAGKGTAKNTAPGAVIIHFFGGIHEIYFPYVLMNPKLILAPMAGGVAGTFMFNLLGAGLSATPSPGSIFAYLAVTPKNSYAGMLIGMAVATIVSFIVAWALLKFTKQPEEGDELQKAADKAAALKGRKLSVDVLGKGFNAAAVKKIVFACDAGMGSSAMGASILRSKVQKAGLGMTVTNTAINEIPGDADIVVTHKSLTERARKTAPDAHHISIDDFLKSPAYDELVTQLKG